MNSIAVKFIRLTAYYNNGLPIWVNVGEIAAISVERDGVNDITIIHTNSSRFLVRESQEEIIKAIASRPEDHQ